MYTTRNKELISIVKILKGFCTILLGNKIRLRTDHNNINQKSTFNESSHILCQRMIIKEYFV